MIYEMNKYVYYSYVVTLVFAIICIFSELWSLRRYGDGSHQWFGLMASSGYTKAECHSNVSISQCGYLKTAQVAGNAYIVANQGATGTDWVGYGCRTDRTT